MAVPTPTVYCRLVFERGLEWNDDPTSRPNSIVVDPLPARIGEIIDYFRNTFGVRPIIIGERINSWGGIQEVRQNLLSLDSKQLLELSLSALTQNRVVLAAPVGYIFFPVHNLLYVLGSLIYHCRNLAVLYSDIANKNWRISEIMNRSSDGVSFQGQEEAYYEFDALITAARRAYEMSRYILWKAFGGEGGQPRNFETTLKACDGIPLLLRERLHESWTTYGVRLKEYRDCIQHYVPVDLGFATATLRRATDKSWRMQIMIPTNPQVHSKRDFTYDETLDALTYCWEVTNHLLTLAKDIIESVPMPQQTDSSTVPPKPPATHE